MAIGRFSLEVCGFLLAVTAAATAQQYDLQVRMEPAAHRMHVIALLDLPATSESRTAIELRLATTMTDVRARVVAPGDVAGPARLTNTGSDAGTTTWQVAPAGSERPFPAGLPIRLRLEYAGGEQGSVGFYLGPEVSFAGGANLPWYPQVGNGRGTGSLTFTFPAGLRLVASGVTGSVQTVHGNTEQHVRVTRPVHLSFVLGPYEVLRHDRGTVATEAYLLQVRPSSRRDLERMSAVIDRLVTEFGPFPFERYAVVEIPTDIALRARFTGISYPGFFALGSGLLDGPFNYASYGHEIAHAWWGVAIGLDASAGGLYTLTEGLAQYGALQVVEALAGPEAAERLRRTGHPGSASNHSGYGYLRLAAAGFDEPLSRLQPGRAGYVLSDSKGFMVYDLLSRTLGREAFRRGLQGVVRAHAFQTLSWPRFVQRIRQESDADLQWFFDQWFERTGAPEWTVEWRQATDTVSGTIEQPVAFYRVDVEVELRSRVCGNRSYTVALRHRTTRFRLPAPCPVDSVEVDPHFRVLHRDPSYQPAAVALAAATRADHLHQVGQRDAARAVYDSALRVLPQPDVHSVEFNLRFGLGRLELAEGRTDQARDQFEAAIRVPSRSPPTSLAFVYVEIARLSRLQGNRPALEQAVAHAVAADHLVGFHTGASEQARALLNGGRP